MPTAHIRSPQRSLPQAGTVYHSFGMLMQGRNHAGGAGYRWGFNGKPQESSLNAIDYGKRNYDPSLNRFISVDPLSSQFPGLSTYQFASNSPIASIDLDGLEAEIIIKDLYYRKKIIEALNIMDINEAHRLSWEAIGKGQPSVAVFKNQNAQRGGLNIICSSGNSEYILLSTASSEVFNVPKKAWPQGGFDWQVITDMRVYASEHRRKAAIINEVLTQTERILNNLKDRWDNYNISLTTEQGDPGHGMRLSRAIIMGRIEIEMESVRKRITNLEAIRAHHLDVASSAENEASRMEKVNITLNE